MSDKQNDEITPMRHLRHYAQVYPHAWEEARKFREVYAKLPDRKDYCYLPLAASLAIIEAEAERQRIDTVTRASLGADICNLGAIIAWRVGKDIYRYDQTIYEALWDTPLDGQIPVHMLYRLPSWCVWVDTPTDPVLNSPGFFAFLEYDPNNGETELRIVIDIDGKLTWQCLYLSKNTIVDCLAETYARSARMAQSELVSFASDAAEAMKQIVAPRLSLLLYLCADEAEIEDRSGRGRKPGRPKPQKYRKGERLFPAAAPVGWEVAVRLGSKLSKAREEYERTQSTGTGKRVPPHLRRAHWHVVPTGKDRSGRKVFWALPWPIAGYDPEKVNPSVIHDVE